MIAARAVTVDGTRPLRSLLSILGSHRKRVTLFTVAYLIKDSPLWVLPVITAAIIDVVVSRSSLHQLALLVLIAALVLAQNYPVGIFYNDQFSRTFRQVGADLRNALVDRLQNLSIGFHTRASASVIQTKVVRDVEQVEQMVQQSYPPIMSAASILVGAITMTAIQVPQFIVVFVVTVPLGVLLLFWVRKRSHVRNELFRKQVERFSARVGEMAVLMPVTRAHGLESHAADRVADSTEGVRSAGFDLDRVNGRFGALSWLSFQFLALFCLALAAAASITGVLDISAGQVVLLSTYFTLITQGIVQLLGLMPVLARGRESLRSIAEVLEEPDLELNHGKRLVGKVRGEILFDRVEFSHPGASRPAIDDLSLTIEAGETVAFVGHSGSGKSTLLNLALGFVRPTSGRIWLDGRDMESIDLRTSRRFVSVVPQESVLFEGSIRDNIAYGLGQVSDERVAAALEAANAMEIVRGLPEGWDSVVGERGARLSGGQRQRLAIARALVRDPRILLLDEATSALDSESESLVKDAIVRLMSGRTTLVVAHRLSTIRSADRIVVMDRGRIAEIGSHDDLLELGGVYARLHAAQLR